MTADNESRRRASASLSASQRLALEAAFTAKPDAKVAIVSASPRHSIAGAAGRSALMLSIAGPLSIHEAAARLNPAQAREAARREAQEARDRFWASLDRPPVDCCCYGLKGCGETHADWRARVKREVTVPVHRQAPGTAPWPPEFIYDDIVPSAPPPTPRDLMLGAVPDLSPCTLPPRPPVVITRVR